VFLVAVVGYSAWVWRLALVEGDDDGPGAGPGMAAGAGSGVAD
jgi:hypothetical protein